ncbi:EAL domain-containing protein [Photobacterium damselae]
MPILGFLMSLYKKQIINIASIFTLTIGALTINQVATDRDLIAVSEKQIIKSELQLIRNYLLTTPSLAEKNLAHIESDIGQLISHENFSHIEISIDDQQIKWLSPIEPKSLSYQLVTTVFPETDYSISRYNANQFLNAIEDLSLGSLFDRNVIIHAINTLLAKKQMPPIAINLTTNSINDPAFIRWLTTTLDTNKNLSHRLYFEIPESCCVRHFDATSILCSTIRFHHFGIGIDNYGRYFQSLNYLQELRPDYVKIDFVYTNQLNDPIKANVLSSICRTAHSLNIKTIATRVETETKKERLSDLFITGFQGFVIEKGITEEKIIA